ncbi:MAG: Crp/Fnr family transcriptional regulator [Bacteroidetes bacterium]|nr:MAG: Crp/Fnr family transcriptional regulator [Bacteroidota bacterium]
MNFLLGGLDGLDQASKAELMADLMRISQRKNFAKHELLHQEGKVCKQLFYVESGLVRAFYYRDGEEITAHFAPEHTMLTAIDSVIQNKASRYSLEVLEDSSILSISYPDLKEILLQKPQYEKVLRMYLERIYIDLAERIEDVLFHTAKERYAKLMKDRPSLLQRVQLKHIASYLGITQETLSRIRANS